MSRDFCPCGRPKEVNKQHNPYCTWYGEPPVLLAAGPPASEAQSGTSALYVTKAAYDVRLAELAQLRARVASLDAQKVELPELPKPLRNSKFWDEGIEWRIAGERAARLERERQLLDALRAVQAKARELEVLWAAHGRLIEAFNVEQEKAEARCKAGDGLCRLLKLIRHAPHPMPPKSELSDELIDTALAAYDALAGKGGE